MLAISSKKKKEERNHLIVQIELKKFKVKEHLLSYALSPCLLLPATLKIVNQWKGNHYSPLLCLSTPWSCHNTFIISYIFNCWNKGKKIKEKNKESVSFQTLKDKIVSEAFNNLGTEIAISEENNQNIKYFPRTMKLFWKPLFVRVKTYPEEKKIPVVWSKFFYFGSNPRIFFSEEQQQLELWNFVTLGTCPFVHCLFLLGGIKGFNYVFDTGKLQ